MNRYLLRFSYIGTRFKSFAKNVRIGTSVVGAIELAMQRMRPVNSFKVSTASRTDTGVHALNSTLHVDIERKNGQLFDSAKSITILNKFFDESNLDINAYSIEPVNPKFHAKSSSVWRTYLYRFAILRTPYSNRMTLHSEWIPIEEWDRCYFRVV